MSRGRTLGVGLATVLTAVAVTWSAVALVGDTDDPGSVAAAPGASTPDSEPSTPTVGPSPEPAPTVSSSGGVSPTRTPSPTPSATDLLAPGATGIEVRELQARLKQIQWYEPEINGEYDAVTTEAVHGFQGKRGLPQTGSVDQATWDRLVAMTQTPTDDEMHNRLVAGPTILGPGDNGAQVRELQARLRQIGWFSGEITPQYGEVTRQSVAGFQRKRGFPITGEVDQRTWDRLVEMTRKPTDDELHNRHPKTDQGGPLDQRCLTGRALCIDKTTRTLRWVVDGDIRMALDVRFGSELTPTREGAFKVGWKSRDHVSSLYHTSMPYAMFFSGGQAVHYSPDFAANGYNGASHGCVNVRDKAAIAALFDNVKVGDKVIVYRS